MKIVREKIDEGLIRTIDIDKTISLIKKNFRLNNYNIIKPYKEKNIYLCIMENIIDYNYVNSFITFLNNLGWFPASLSQLNIPYSTENLNILQKLIDDENKYAGYVIRFDSKYSIVYDNVPEFLYHVTPKEKYENIKRIGLIPKNNNKLSYHTERVYVGIDKEDIIRLANILNKTSKRKNKDYVLLRIDTKEIPDVIFYKDPAYEFGLYTLSNIPKIAITKEGDITL